MIGDDVDKVDDDEPQAGNLSSRQSSRQLR